MYEHLRNILQYNCQIQTNSPVVVGVSGGPDSLFLLDLMLNYGAQVVIAHLDHSLRPESASEAEFVREIAQDRKLAFIGRKENVNSYVKKNKISIEEAARILRYRFLFEEAKRIKAHAVAVGHTADDQVETVLMNLFRGSGMKGLSGMGYRLLPSPWSNEIALVRPLIGLWRRDIDDYLKIHGIDPLIDPTNKDTTLLRNKIREEVIPYLEKRNPRLREALWRTADILRSENQYLEGLTVNAWSRCVLADGLHWITFDRSQFLDEDIAIQRRLLKLAINNLRSSLADIKYHSIEISLKAINDKKHTGSIDIGLGLYVRLEGDRIWIASWEADLPSQDWPQVGVNKKQVLQIPGRVDLGKGWILKIREITHNEVNYEQIFTNQDPYEAWIDAAKVNKGLFVRNRKAGERFKPYGMDGHALKLSDFMINVKMPIRSRPTWPLVCDEEAIVWIPGYRMADSYQVSSRTRRIFHMVLRKFT